MAVAEVSQGPRPKRWSVEEYLRLCELGAIGAEDHLELIEGEIVEKMGQNLGHRVACRALIAALRAVFGEGCDVNAQIPIPLEGSASVPEPDVAVLRGDWRAFSRRDPRPDEVALVVEVSDRTRLAFDRGPKLSVYAKAGLAEYWILNLVDRRLEVYRQPQPDGFYSESRVYAENESASPLDRPEVSIRVADLLPPADSVS